ncbi:amidohydrolase family protein [Amphibacillus jilinensis]|uniref:amidohydrolase family protein n=1 Tax=Amphibacillus jilinensis TaxID=1216008 RepID=UPI002406635C|nr:amidohydrolase family protein [Amphibacillus jilinensis]
MKGWKINPHVCGFNVDSRESIDLIKTLEETNMPILSCSGFGVPEDFFATTILTKKQKVELDTQRIKQFYKVLKTVPNATFILAHGGCFEIDELIELMKRFPNTYTDISIQPSNNIKKLIDKIGSERILFGTDYPFVNHAFSIVSVLRATSDDEQLKNIFSRNALRILKL